MPGNAYRERNFQCTLTVYQHLQKGLSPSLLWKHNVLKERQVKHVLVKLKAAGLINKIAYGTWETTVSDLTQEMLERRYNRVHRVTPTEGTIEKEGTIAKPDTDRMHGVQVKLKIPQINNWDKRSQILKSKKMEFTPIVQGQRILYKGMKIWLCRGSVVMYLPHSWFADTSAQAVERATRDVISIVMGLEKHLGVSSFKIKGKYVFKFSKQHHALIKNAQAQILNFEGKKYRIRDEHGEWLTFDDSYRLDEAEFTHPDTSPEDFTKVQNFYNSLKRNPIVTEQVTETYNALDRLNPAIEKLTEQIELHLAATQEWKNTAGEVRDAVKDLTGVERAKTGHSGPQNGRIEEVLDLLSVLVQDKIIKGEAREEKGLEKFTGSDKDVEVEFLDKLPKVVIPYRGALKTIGPFNHGARVYIPIQVARLLIEKGTARETGESIAYNEGPSVDHRLYS